MENEVIKTSFEYDQLKKRYLKEKDDLVKSCIRVQLNAYELPQIELAKKYAEEVEQLELTEEDDDEIVEDDTFGEEE
jgi:hypothetical protein